MRAFTQHTGVAAALLRINVDTDAIIPSREMKTVSKRGLSGGLFAGWRYTTADTRELNPDFILNKPDYANTSILLSGANFGCGSSREHAVWALAEYGIRCIIASSFGSIFYNNCIRNGILPIVLEDTIIQTLAEHGAKHPQKNQLTIDLARCQLSSCAGHVHAFPIAANHQNMLLNGLDPIGLTQQQASTIDAFHAADKKRRSWAYLPD
ncbi:MAG: 3-isopropylmalate dehydratase small subunit [Oceanococcus sp.]